jgi:hypothetical protein
MRALQRQHARLLTAFARATSEPERGDVPGWVLITLMTAGLVAALWAVAQDQLTALFQEALASARR